jgi:hypothetical protein
MTFQALCASEGTLTSVARQLLDSRTRVLLLRLLFVRLLCIFGFIEICIRACFACSQRASLRRSLGGGHFDTVWNGDSVVCASTTRRSSNEISEA